MAWPETYSYTLSTAIDAGTAILATRIGAFPERLAGRPFTWLADIATPTRQWLALFREIRGALNAPVKSINIPKRSPIADFYESDYLRPSQPQSRPKASPAGPRIMIIPELFEPWHPTPCAYIRLLQPLYHPAITGDAQLRVVEAKDAVHYQADLIITQRHAIPDIETADAIAAHARRIGAPIVFDLDDDLLNIPATHPDAKTLRPKANVVRRMLKHADTVWVSTSSLAASLASVRPDAVVIENRLDERIWTPTETTGPVCSDPVRILAMGTNSHKDDFAMIEPALRELKRQHGHRVLIDILGMTNQSDLAYGLNRIGPSPQGSRSYPAFVDWLCARRPAWHIGLAPLVDTKFNRCKSSLKALDYAALGMTVVASDVPVYRGSIADGAAGQLVPNTTEAWYGALNWLIRDQATLNARTAQARKTFPATGTLISDAGHRRDTLKRALTGARPANNAPDHTERARSDVRARA